MSHLVKDHIIKADSRFLGEIEFQPDQALGRVAAAPLPFHLFDNASRHREI